jgi:hypothetical protein
MTVGWLAALASAIFAGSAVALAPPDAGIPAQFRGEWNIPGSACGTADRDSTRIVIGSSVVRFGRETGVVTRIMRASRDEIDITALYSGMDERSLRSDRLTLSAAGRDLTVGEEPDAVIRRRCARRPPR